MVDDYTNSAWVSRCQHPSPPAPAAASRCCLPLPPCPYISLPHVYDASYHIAHSTYLLTYLLTYEHMISYLPPQHTPSTTLAVSAPCDGVVSGIDALAIGKTGVLLGAGAGALYTIPFSVSVYRCISVCLICGGRERASDMQAGVHRKRERERRGGNTSTDTEDRAFCVLPVALL